MTNETPLKKYRVPAGIAALACITGLIIWQSEQTRLENKARNLAKAEKCIASLKDCNSSIETRLLPEEIKKDVQSRISEAKTRRLLVDKANSCHSQKTVSTCSGIDINKLRKIDPVLAKNANDSLWTANQKVAKAKREAEEFKRMGWWEVKDGIFARYCTNGPKPCSSAGVIGDASYVLVEIWCKERSCGDIYGRVNLLNSAGTVVGWTNDTGYGGYGQKVVLTFDSYRDGWSKAQITELNFR